ncbi:hydrocephalus-inducing protein homolog [Motacilla alba alba]|uniref:hydrocephalus-inducing protein homolog n=1 Tax=Motacilla alba alba TaxID=1094192 RepID=UPI0018D4DAE2|nr:hydrocephalus-inducing protein homolog [Motacilla alba alba]
MGPVLKGYTETHTLKISNPGQIHASFQVDVSVLQDTGFSVDLDQMNGLPPNHTLEFDVRFESAHKPQGDVEVVLPIEVTEGPVYNVRLHATVLELSLDLSKNRLQFSDILVGHCQVETIRLHNRFRVPCRWFITASKPVVKKDHLKYVTPAVRQKMQAPEDEPCPFEVTPSKGTLGPGKWQNLQIQFTPKEEVRLAGVSPGGLSGLSGNEGLVQRVCSPWALACLHIAVQLGIQLKGRSIPKSSLPVAAGSRKLVACLSLQSSMDTVQAARIGTAVSLSLGGILNIAEIKQAAGSCQPKGHPDVSFQLIKQDFRTTWRKSASRPLLRPCSIHAGLNPN